MVKVVAPKQWAMTCTVDVRVMPRTLAKAAG